MLKNLETFRIGHYRLDAVASFKLKGMCIFHEEKQQTVVLVLVANAPIVEETGPETNRILISPAQTDQKHIGTVADGVQSGVNLHLRLIRQVVVRVAHMDVIALCTGVRHVVNSPRTTR